jgi:hypothetical protein
MVFEMDTETSLVIEAEVSGRYIPATWGYSGGSPPEYPQIDTIKVMFGNVEVTDEIGKKEMEKIEEQVMEEYDKDAFETDEVQRYG